MGAATTTEPVRRIVVSYSKTGPARFMGHLDMLRCFQRATRRAGLPIAYSNGFNPHPRMTFASPLPVGAAGLREMAAIDLVEQTDPGTLAEKLNSALPPGVEVRSAWVAQLGSGTFGAEIESHWFVGLAVQADAPKDAADWNSALSDLLAVNALPAERAGGKSRDVRSRLLGLTLEEASGMEAVLQMVLLQKDDLSAKPMDVVRALENRMGPLRISFLERRAVITSSERGESGGTGVRDPAPPARDASRASDAKPRGEGGEKQWQKR